jgi:hypothetical protein
MGPAEYVHKRKSRYMAQVLEEFELHLEEPLKAAGLHGEIQNFKGLVRARINALATDAVDVFTLEGPVNEFGLDVRDQIQGATTS